MQQVYERTLHTAYLLNVSATHVAIFWAGALQKIEYRVVCPTGNINTALPGL
jgi:hypothetical protein